MLIRILLNIFLLTQLFFASHVFASGGYDNGTAAGKGKLDLDLTINPGDLSNEWPESLDEKGQSYLVWGYGLDDEFDFHGYVSHGADGTDQIYYGLKYNFLSTDWLDLSTATGLRHIESRTDLIFPQLLYTIKLSNDFDIIGSFTNIYNTTDDDNIGQSSDVAFRIPVPESLTPSFFRDIKIAVGLFKPSTRDWKPSSDNWYPTYSIDCRF